MAHTYVRHETSGGPAFIGKKAIDTAAMGFGFFWTFDQTLAHPFASEAEARELLVPIIPHAGPHHITFVNNP